MKVALVCDWLTNVGGAEKVLLRLHQLYPEAPIYTSKYDPEGIDWFEGADVRTGWLQKFPSKMRRVLGPLRQRYFSHLDLSEYDLIISVTGAEAKAVKSGSRLHAEGKKNVKNPNGLHISYCHVPTQYYWQMYDEYIKNPGFGILNPVIRFFFKIMVKPLRRADLKAAQSPEYYVTISEYAKNAIKKYYGREAEVIHPPVDIENFQSKACGKPVKNPYYVVTSRQVNWKKIDLAVSACFLAQRHLIVIGEGPEHKKLVKMAEGSKLVEFLPLMDKKKLVKYLAEAKGYLFPSLEPFGIAPVEALAAGCPVIAYGVGGARDYVKDGKNGILFEPQSVEALAEAILKFEKKNFDRKKIASSVDDYSEARFDKEIKAFVKKCKKTRKVVKTLKDKKKLSCASIYRALIYVLPGVLCLSFYPVIKLGSSESMNYELSLPLIWLAMFDVVTLVMTIQKKRLIGGFSKKLVWSLFPGFLTISVLWSLNFTRGLLTVGILWLICFAVYGMWELRSVLKEKRFKDRLWKVFFGSYLVVCVWCVVQCIMDLAGVSREASLMCAGCTYRMFGFPHPNGFAIEPQFMGNLLLAPAIVSAWKAMDRKKYLILFFIFSVGIFLTFSRGAIYAFVVAMIFMVAMEGIRRKVWGVCKIFLVIAVAFVFTLNLQGVMAAVSPTNDTYVSGVAKVLNHLSLGIIDIRETEENGGEAATVEEAQSEEPETPSDNEGERAVFDGYVEESTDTRVKLSGAAIEVWRKGPKTILVGVGLGGAGQALYVNGLSSSPKEIVQNEYASLLLETGLIGVILLILTLVLIIRVMQKSMAMPMLLTLLVAYGITMMFFSGLPNALHMYLLTGLFVVLSRNSALDSK